MQYVLQMYVIFLNYEKIMPKNFKHGEFNTETTELFHRVNGE